VEEDKLTLLFNYSVVVDAKTFLTGMQVATRYILFSVEMIKQSSHLDMD
jgi:hypothetical protein